MSNNEETGDLENDADSTKLYYNIYYPHEVTIYRKTTYLSRVTQPINISQLMVSSPEFKISKDRTFSFGITQVAGIVFVQNVSALQNAPETTY